MIFSHGFWALVATLIYDHTVVPGLTDAHIYAIRGGQHRLPRHKLSTSASWTSRAPSDCRKKPRNDGLLIRANPIPSQCRLGCGTFPLPWCSPECCGRPSCEGGHGPDRLACVHGHVPGRCGDRWRSNENAPPKGNETQAPQGGNGCAPYYRECAAIERTTPAHGRSSRGAGTHRAALTISGGAARALRGVSGSKFDPRYRDRAGHNRFKGSPAFDDGRRRDLRIR